MDPQELHLLEQDTQRESAESILGWAWEQYKPDIAASSSFQTQSLPLLHMISAVCPEMPVLFLDTGFHFPETLKYRDELENRLGINVQVLRPRIDKRELFARYGEGLYRRDPNLCCYINKVEPMQRAVSGLRAWVSGVRRDQTATRSALEPIQEQSDGLVRVHPLLDWTSEDIWHYVEEHDLPYHPLFEKGYRSIGCAPCTRPVDSDEDERAGRWANLEKTECGLHTGLMTNGRAPHDSRSEDNA